MSGEKAAAQSPAAEPRSERAPLGSWARAYALVIAAFAVDLLFLWWLTERYR